jgi:hypothetical protein
VATIFDEGFEGAGEEESGWYANGSGNDTDYATSGIGSPSGWESQCYESYVSGSGDSYLDNDLGGEAIVYVRVEVYVDTWNGSNGDQTVLLATWEYGWGADGFSIRLTRVSDENRFVIVAYHDDSYNEYESIGTFSVNTKYCIEAKWDATNGYWAWKIDGVAQPNNIDGTSPVTSEGTLTGGATDTGPITCGIQDYGSSPGGTVYLDNVTVNDSDWVGPSGVPAVAEITGTATASIDETDIVDGGKTIIITLTGDTFITN